MNTAVGSFASTTLAGQELSVPDDLTGPTALLFAYQQHQQIDVNTWLRAAAGDPRLRVLEVPVIRQGLLPARSRIDGNMASQMDEQTRAQTMCLYTDVARFQREVLGVTSDEVLAVLVDQAGTVHWHALGPATKPSEAAFLAAAEALAPRDPRT